MQSAVVEDLRQRVVVQTEHLDIHADRRIDKFEQYSHLGVVRELVRDSSSGGRLAELVDEISTLTSSFRPSALESKLSALLDDLSKEELKAREQRRLLLGALGEESVLGLDVAIGRTSPYRSDRSDLPHLAAGFSVKWSLRTDRAQDPRSQGAKLSALRRGRMPHFAVIVMEPRPYFLSILGRGAGDVDCVYHLHLPALETALESVCNGSSATSSQRQTWDTFCRLRDQGRLRDYDDLVDLVRTL
ncbi:hypothetical protein O4J56_10065 [Nocardiopsis sp. RSe5-2]|uniref:Uncharacterized protein n=1 Tax=Nocardiopsis endophytica TaxID=3018445 RepID=A0ABT4U3F9_9ACTN|nr:NgoMIV family type II restriction endonuclease [Nocardiopsis endophytica]MDA2810980.1 hypothetical protein [Nocardiopsis endophytica]